MKKFLSLLLAVVMMLSIAPVSVFASDSGYQKGDIIEFGSYPQSQVTDEALLSELNKFELEWEIEYAPTRDDYSGMIDDTKLADMLYSDIEFSGEKYRAVKFSDLDEINFFLYEPIEWIILDPDTGMVISKTVLDKKTFYDYYYFCETENGFTVYTGDTHDEDPLDYTKSDIRTWLNEDLYDTAFDQSEKASIKLTEIDNYKYVDSYSYSDILSAEERENATLICGVDEENGIYEYIYEVPAYESVEDRVFLLSAGEYIKYGFDENRYDENDIENDIGLVSCSDYAKNKGLYVWSEYWDYGVTWWMRSAGGNHISICCFYPEWRLDTWFAFASSGSFCASSNGVRPVMCINLETFDEEPTTAEPTTEAPTTTEPSTDMTTVVAPPETTLPSTDENSSEVITVMKGDMDGSGTITASDARTALRISAKLEEASDELIAVADMDGNGTVTAADARKILRISAKLETA